MHQDGTIPICSYATNIKDLGVGDKKNKYEAKKYIRHIFDEDIPHPNLWAMLFDAKIIKDNNFEIDIIFLLNKIENEKPVDRNNPEVKVLIRYLPEFLQ